MSNNILLNVPVMSKPGAFPLRYSLAANSYMFNNSGTWATQGISGSPFSLNIYGFGAGGLILFDNYSITFGVLCPDGHTLTNKLTNWYVQTADGTYHYLPSTDYIDDGGCLNRTFTDTATDNSGITIAVDYSYTCCGYVKGIYDRSGNRLGTVGVSLQANITDPNGNSIHSVSTGTGSGTTTFTDTLGLQALTVTTSFSAKTINSAWTDVNGGSPQVTVGPSGSGTWKTNFGCTGINELGGSSGISEPTSTAISFPDSTSIGISYEATPGFAGDYTGRIGQITLREGGAITYTYGGGSNGIDCTYQTVPVLTRQTSDGTTTYTLAHSLISGSNYKAVNTVVDPGNNETDYTFTGFTSTGVSGTYGQVLTQVKKYQGNCLTSCTLLTTDLYSYNTSYTSTPSASTIANAQVTIPVTKKIVYQQINGMSNWSATETHFDIYGNVTYTASYDFGGASPVRETVTTYGSCTAGCNTTSPTISNTAMAANNIYDKPGTIVTKQNGIGVSRVTYTYSAVGNKTFSYVWDGYTSSFLWNTTANVYNANGTPSITYDINNNETDYTYTAANYSNYAGTCGSATQYPFPTSVKNVGTGLRMQYYYDCTGGVVVKSLDANGDITTYGYADVTSGSADPFWRVRYTQDTNGHTAQQWFAQNGKTTYFKFNSGNSINETTSNWDSYGRPSSTVTFQSPSGSNYDWVQATYGWSGNYQQKNTSQPCSAGLSGGCSLVHTMLYDPLGRLHSESTTSNETITHTYPQNDDLAVLTSGPSVQTEYDGLGRVSKVCHIGTTASTGSGTACNQNTNTGAVGATDAYTYSQGTGYTSVAVSRNGTQTRTNVYDTLGRLVQKTTPEGGTWTYVYDHTANCNGASQTSPGNLVCSTDPNGNSSIYYYDSMNRLTDVGTGNGGSTACKRFRYDSTANHYLSVPTGATIVNVLGKLMEAETDNCAGTSITDEWFSYDNELHMTDMWEATPHSTQYYHSVATFYDNGAVNTIQLASPSNYTLTYGLDGEGRWNTLTDTTHSTTIVSGATFFPAANPEVISLNGTDNDAYTVDLNTGRVTKYVFTVGSTPVSLTGALSWSPNGTLSSLATTDGFNSGGTQTCNDGYDSWGRLTSFDCGSLHWGQNFSYDIDDNLTKTVISGRTGTTWSPTYPSNNQYGCGASCTYDANGNVTGDGNNTFQWNEFSKLKSTATSGVPTCGTSGKCLIYDAFGRIVEMSNGSSWTEVWLTQNGGVANMSGATVNYAVWPTPEGGSVVMAGSAYSYLHKDWLGNARLATTVTTHSITADQAYTPYGEIFANFGSALSQFDIFAGISGNFNDGVMWDTPNRELSIVGRWLSPDPAGTGWNQYAYPTNPNSFNDPSGLFKCAVDAETGGVLRGQLCTTANDPYFGSDGDSGEGGGGFSFSFDVSPPCDSDFMPCGLYMPGLYEQIWSDVLGLPSGLNCPQTGGIFSPLCGGVSPIEDWKGSYTDCVKQAGEDFSLQNALRSFNPKWGDSWFASTFLGNGYSDYIGYGQHLFSKNRKGLWNDFVQYVEDKDVEALERESVKKIVETANIYNLGAVVVSAGVLCPATYEGK